MSELYVSEPPTNGKVLVHTTLGEIDIELWPKECPRAVRNFVQLCMEGYYNGCVFHRVIKGFMAQTGDPSGTGQGGDSIYGDGDSGQFKDEFHSRLKFTRRGLVGMASSGRDTNRSQFFFTFGPCEWLNKQSTLFGRCSGTTVFNMLKLQEVETDSATDRPLQPPKILKTEILSNPFPDIVPRVLRKAAEEEEAERKKKKRTPAARKDTKLLSFGEEAEGDESATAAAAAVNTAAGQKKASKAAHDIVTDDPRLLAVPAIPSGATGSAAEAEEAARRTAESVRAALKKKPASGPARPPPSSSSASASASSSSSSGSGSGSRNGHHSSGGGDDLDDFRGTDAEYDALMKSKLLAKRGITGVAAAPAGGVDSGPSDPVSAHAAEEAMDSKQLKAEYAKLKRQVLSLKKTPGAPAPDGTLLLMAPGSDDDDDSTSASASASGSSSAAAAAAKKPSIHSLDAAKAKSTSKRSNAFSAVAFEKDKADRLDALTGADDSGGGGGGGGSGGTTDNLMTSAQQRQSKFVKRKKLTKNREADTLAKLEAFQNQIRTKKGGAAASVPASASAASVEEQTRRQKEREKERVAKQAALAADLQRAKDVRRAAKNAKELELLELLEKSDDARSEVIAGGKTASANAITAEDGDAAGPGKSDRKAAGSATGGGDGDDENDPDWLSHSLKFAKRPQDFDAMARRSDEYEYSYFDPRDPNAANAGAAGSAGSGGAATGSGSSVAASAAAAKRAEANAKLMAKNRAAAGVDQDQLREELLALEAEGADSAAAAVGSKRTAATPANDHATDQQSAAKRKRT